MRTPIIVGNWKLHTLRREALELATGVATAAAGLGGRVAWGVAPPALWIGPLREALGAEAGIWAQNCATDARGAFTGELAPDMLREAGASGVILGHSERRHVFGEPDEAIGRKVSLALAEGLDVILCVGETLDERRAGSTLAVVHRQLERGLSAVERAEADRMVIAYEPVWAIGTGETASPAQAQEVHAGIRAWLAARWDEPTSSALRIQYGGSAKPANAAGLLAEPDVDGLLVGGASLDAESFGAMLASAAG
ncbi:MAG: triose-phosphate isomerase [Deltaproteobacteria bacterium]|nr:MAG: triose-phosphate isomerase [Deltaproteobacteria bacterium]